MGVVRGFAGSEFGAIACAEERAGMGELTGSGVDLVLGLGCGAIGKEKDVGGGDADRSSRVAVPKSVGKGGLALITGIRCGGAVGLVGGDPSLGSLGVAIFGANGCGLFDGLTPMGLGVD